MNRKTVAILTAAAATVAAAVVLTQKPTATASVVTTTTPGQPALPGGAALTPPGTCGVSTSASRHHADFGHGTFVAALSASRVLEGGDGEVFLSLDLQAREHRAIKRPPLNLAIVVDRSGSMAGEPIEHARSAALGMIERLGPMDRVALVQYDHAAQVVVPSRLLDAAGKAHLSAAIAGLRPGGSTNLHDGMALGIAEVQKEPVAGSVNRVILLSDGIANAGVTDTPSIARAASSAADRGVRVTAVGLGLSYNEDLMEAIAEAGRGQYYYVRDAAALDQVFAGEIRSMQATVATAAELRLEPACPGVEIVEVFGYDSRRDGAAVVIPMADIFGGDARKVIVKLRTPTAAAGRRDLLAATLAFQDAETRAARSTRIALGVEITRDTAAVEASIDADVATQVVQVESAKVLREAAEAYDRGDVAAATAGLREGRERAEKKAAKYKLSPAAAAPVYDQIDNMAGSVGRYAPNSAEGRDVVKFQKQNARELSKKKQ